MAEITIEKITVQKKPETFRVETEVAPTYVYVWVMEGTQQITMGEARIGRNDCPDHAKDAATCMAMERLASMGYAVLTGRVSA